MENPLRSPAGLRWTWFPVLFLIGFGFYFHQISLSDQPYWDEAIYLNAARAYLSGVKPYPNPEHPPLGKLLIMTGLKLWGDQPAGWRFSASVAGGLSAALCVAIVFRLTRRRGVAMFVGALFLLDPLLYVHFRLGMLDPSLLLFLLAATACALRFWENPRLESRWLYLLGISLGLGLATKMLALILMPVFWGFVLLRCRKEALRPRLALDLVLSALVLPLTLYFGCYRLLGFGLAEAWTQTRYNFSFHQFHRGAAVMSSRWYEWLYVGKPVWYYFRRLADGQVQAVLATGNLVLWIGAQLLAAYAVIRNPRRPELWFLAALILVQFAIYVFKPVTFLQYMITILPYVYMLMGVGIGDLFRRYEGRHRRILQIDFACFFLGVLAVFWNYYPYIHGIPMSRAAFEAIGAPVLPASQP